MVTISAELKEKMKNHDMAAEVFDACDCEQCKLDREKRVK